MPMEKYQYLSNVWRDDIFSKHIASTLELL